MTEFYLNVRRASGPMVRRRSDSKPMLDRRYVAPGPNGSATPSGIIAKAFMVMAMKL